MGTEGLFEDVENDPLWQMAGVFANAPPQPAKGYVTAPLAWLAGVLPVVRTTAHLVVAMLIYRECLPATEPTLLLCPTASCGNSASAATRNIGLWLGCVGPG